MDPTLENVPKNPGLYVPVAKQPGTTYLNRICSIGLYLGVLDF